MGILALMAVGLPIGFLIGLVGIGGVLLAPALANLFGRSVHEAVAMSLASFAVAGGVAAALTLRADTRLGFADWCLLASVIPGALAGAFAAPFIPEAALRLFISVCIVLAGLFCLRTAKSAGGGGIATAGLVGLGVGAGFLSVISGTGGPMVLVPMLLAAGMEVRALLAVSQIAQLPIATTATIVNGASGSLDFAGAAALSVAIVAGMLAGLAVSRHMEAAALRRIVAWCLVVTGTGLMALDLWRFAGLG
jgi:uncharacterized membrane protein YfcA